MTIQLAVEVGDRVRFHRELPDLEHHVGWAELDGGDLTPVTVSWTEHFGGIRGIVDCVDIPNGLVRVRGKDSNGQDFTVWVDPQHLEVKHRALEPIGEED